MFVLKLILYSVRFEETKMDLEKSYTNHQYITKIWLTLYIGYAREIEKDKICCDNKSYFIEEKNNKLTLSIQKPVSLAISCFFLFERDTSTKI